MKKFSHLSYCLYALVGLLVCYSPIACKKTVDVCFDDAMHLSGVYLRDLAEGNFEQLRLLSTSTSYDIIRQWELAYEKMSSTEKEILRKSTFIFPKNVSSMFQSNQISITAKFHETYYPTLLHVVDDGLCKKIDLSQSSILFFSKQ